MTVKVFSAVLLASSIALGGLLLQRAVTGGEEKTRPAAVQAGVPERLVRLRQGDVPIGSLGHPLGASLTVEGKRQDCPKCGTRTLLVEKINGKELKEPVGIWVENLRELPNNTHIVFKGYETGKIDGPVPAAIQAAEEKGDVVLLPQRGWQWNAYFIALEAVQPKLEIREEKTGFKTAKQKKSEEVIPLR